LQFWIKRWKLRIKRLPDRQPFLFSLCYLTRKLNEDG
jgi:hypothetical protein